MGHYSKNFVKKSLQQTRMGKLVKELEELHAQPLASWQKERIAEIRRTCEDKEKKLFEAANVKCQEVREEFMQFEIDFIHSSRAMRKEDANAKIDSLVKPTFFQRLFGKSSAPILNTQNASEKTS